MPIKGPTKALETGWKVHGRVVVDTIHGEWFSTVAHSTRHGVVMLQFLDYGRAVGYCIGTGGGTHPIYGYWIMARKDADVRLLAAEAIKHFASYDIGYLVAQFERLGAQPTNIRI